MLAAACEHEPEFLALVERPSSRPFMVRAVIDTGSQRPEESLDQWIVKVTARYLGSLCEGQDSPLHMLSTLAYEEFLLGECSRYD